MATDEIRRWKRGDEHLDARTPPGVVYHDERVFREDLERFYYRYWLNVGRQERIPNPGDFFTRTIGRESVIFIRGQDGAVRGFYNVCRHRGTRLVEAERGEKLRSIVCPYHAWTYSTEGALVGTPHMDDVRDFDRADYGLHPVRTEAWGGFIWATLDPKGASLRASLGDFLDRVGHVRFEDLRLVDRRVYEVDANWKILAENFSECYHCAPIHPGLNRVTPYYRGENVGWLARGRRRQPWNGGWVDFAGDYNSMTVSGYTKRPPLKGLREDERRRIYYYLVFPNLFFSVHPDFLMIHRDWPTSPGHSVVECEWYFDPDVMAEPGFDPSDAVDMWDEINRQDWAICEQTMRGVRSRAWTGGRFSQQEPLVHDFDKYYVEMSAPRAPSRARSALVTRTRRKGR